MIIASRRTQRHATTEMHSPAPTMIAAGHTVDGEHCWLTASPTSSRCMFTQQGGQHPTSANRLSGNDNEEFIREAAGHGTYHAASMYTCEGRKMMIADIVMRTSQHCVGRRAAGAALAPAIVVIFLH